jgi:O-antigen ligase
MDLSFILYVIPLAMLFWAFALVLIWRGNYWIGAAMFLTTMVYKSILLYRFPIIGHRGFFDPTMQAALATIVAMLFAMADRARAKQIDWTSIGIFMALGAYMGISLLWTRAPEYGFDKFIRFITLGTTALASGMLVAEAKDFRRMIWFLAFALAPAIVSIVFAPVISSSGRGTLGVDDALNIALPLGFLAMFILAMGHLFSKAARWTLYAYIPFLAMGIISTGSRASFLQIPFTFVVAKLFGAAGNRWLWRTAFIVFTLGGGAFLLVGGDVNVDLGRATAIDFNTIKSNSRVEQWKSALIGGFERPFGGGSGDFAYRTYGVDTRHYPHNIVLEAWYEFGVVGLGLLSWLFLRGALRCLAARNQPAPPTPDATVCTSVLICLISAMLVILVHFDLSDNRALYVVLGCVAGAAQRRPLLQGAWLQRVAAMRRMRLQGSPLRWRST